jgi:hypothetical protein
MKHITMITFIKGIQYLIICEGEYDQQESGKINKLSHHLNPALHSV